MKEQLIFTVYLLCVTHCSEIFVCVKAFPTWAWRDGSTEKDGEENGRSATDENTPSTFKITSVE